MKGRAYRRKTIAEVAEFTDLPQTSQMKSLVMVADGKPVLALLRGDHQLSETKFAVAVGGALEVRPAQPGEINDWFGADPGSLGPIGVANMQIIADLALEGRRNMIAGTRPFNDADNRESIPWASWTTEWAPFEVQVGRINEYTIKLPEEVLNVVRDQLKERATAP